MVSPKGKSYRSSTDTIKHWSQIAQSTTPTATRLVDLVDEAESWYNEYVVENEFRREANKDKISQGNLRWWQKFERTGGPSSTGIVKREQLTKLTKLLNTTIEEPDLQKMFTYLENFNERGVIELPDLVNFLECPLCPKDLVRYQMSRNLHQPQHFVRYSAFIVDRRPFNFMLKAGPGKISAIYFSSTDPVMSNTLQPGSRLVNVNKAWVEWSKFNDIEYTLNSLPCPFILVFRNDANEDWDCEWNGLTSREKGMFCTDLPVTEDVNTNNLYFGHCKHCPYKDAWYLRFHRFMEDETYSTLGRWTQLFIMFLIVISIIVYVLESESSLESWPGWQLFEGIISIIFTVEFILRIAVCRSMTRYILDSMNLVDLLAVLPYWIEIASQGTLDAGVLRTIRLIRLARLVRLMRNNSRIGLFNRTIATSITWLWTFFVLGFMMMMVFSSILSVVEGGKLKKIGKCDVLDLGSCINDSYPYDLSVWASPWDCELSCESYASDVHDGCCHFDIMTGGCFYHTLSSSTIGNDYAGICHSVEIYLRGGEDSESPFSSIPSTLWFVVVSMMMVGYGEIYPFSEIGRAISVFMGYFGLMFMSLVIIMISFNMRTEYRKLPDGSLRKSDTFESGDVLRYLTKVNKSIGVELFVSMDEVTLIGASNNLDSEERIQQILRFNHWAYLPYSKDYRPGIPRLTQFKLFVLFAMFGRRYHVLDNCSTGGSPGLPIYIPNNDEF